MIPYVLFRMVDVFDIMWKIVKIKKNPGMSRCVQTFEWYCIIIYKIASNTLLSKLDVVGCAVAEVFVGYTQTCLRMVSWWLKISL